SYREYILGSAGEFTVAKDQYIRPRSGWFSDRSACYLAAGKPVITQDTGFGNSCRPAAACFPFGPPIRFWTPSKRSKRITGPTPEPPRKSRGNTSGRTACWAACWSGRGCEIEGPPGRRPHPAGPDVRALRAARRGQAGILDAGR